MKYAKLRGKIIEVYRTQKAFAKAMGLSQAGLSQRLRGKTSFTVAEIKLAKSLLEIADEDLVIYFFSS